MATWVEQVHSRAALIHDQIAARVRLAQTPEFSNAMQDESVSLENLTAHFYRMLERLYSEELPAARLRDTSDLVLRAEGPGADHEAPSLRSFNWLADHVKSQLDKLTAAVLPMTAKDAKAASKQVDWVFNGYAPGSIMMGFSLRQPESMAGFEESDRAAYESLSLSAQSIATIPQFVGDSEMNPGLSDAISDPALRDAAVVAAWMLSPTDKSGIHTVEVSARNGDYGTLSQRERMVLRREIDRPEMRQRKTGTFIGAMRAADLDKRRVTLRDVDGIGAIRCILDGGMESQARTLFGGPVRVTGEYETNREGRPRLMRISRIEPYGSLPLAS